MQRVLIGLDIRETNGKYRVSAAAGIEREALSKSKVNHLYSRREPIFLTYATVTSTDAERGARACIQRIIEKLYLQRIFNDTNKSEKNILVITKPKYKHLDIPLNHTVSAKNSLITIARTMER